MIKRSNSTKQASGENEKWNQFNWNEDSKIKLQRKMADRCSDNDDDDDDDDVIDCVWNCKDTIQYMAEICFLPPTQTPYVDKVVVFTVDGEICCCWKEMANHENVLTFFQYLGQSTWSFGSFVRDETKFNDGDDDDDDKSYHTNVWLGENKPQNQNASIADTFVKDPTWLNNGTRHHGILYCD